MSDSKGQGNEFGVKFTFYQLYRTVDRGQLLPLSCQNERAKRKTLTGHEITSSAN